ncbi:MAG: zf-HC2 domain-containing protein [Synergistaceae bacterium]|nr:zf-HC2 domain-containing protein [Synergistaceae bacterium]
MSREMPDERTRKISCFECEPLLSKACDNECTPEETALMREHLKVCPECRRAFAEYRGITALMSARHTAISCPPAPSVTESAPFVMKVLASPRAKRCALRAAAAVACFLFFMAGGFAGSYNTKREIAKGVSPVSVTTPSMWAARKLAGDALLTESIDTEQPFTDSISQYRLAVGQELRRDDVDWIRVRELVEAIGELRTDLELLTIHMAYLEIRTGNSPYEVAEHWESLGEKTVYK